MDWTLCVVFASRQVTRGRTMIADFVETRAVLPSHGSRITPHGMPARQAPEAAKPGGRLPGPS